MAIVNGYEYDSPEDIMAYQEQQLQKMRASGDPNAINAANSQAVISALFNSPQLKKAKQTQQTLSDTVNQVSRNKGESEADFQIRQAQAIRSGLAKIDPKVALQANDNIIRLQSEALEQQKLKLFNDTADQELQNSLYDSIQMKTPTLFRRTGDGDLTPVASLKIGATDEEITALQASWQETDPSNEYVVGAGINRLDLEDIDKGRAANGGIPKSGIAKIETAIDETANLFYNTGQLMEAMIEAPLSLTAGAGVLADAGSKIGAVRRIGASMVRDDVEAGQDSDIFDSVMTRTKFLEKAEDLGVDSSVAYGLMLNMAYNLAKTNDPGGRLSDKDVDMAIQMIVGAGDPNSFKRLIRQRMMSAAFAADTHKLRATSGALNGEVGLAKWNRYEAERAKVFGLLDTFDGIIDSGGLAQAKTGVFGKTDQANRAAAAAAAQSGAPAQTIEEKRAALRARMGQ